MRGNCGNLNLNLGFEGKLQLNCIYMLYRGHRGQILMQDNLGDIWIYNNTDNIWPKMPTHDLRKCKTNVYSLRAVSHRQICWVLINTGDGIREALQNVREKFGRIPYLPIIGHFDTADNLTRTTWHRGQFDTTCKNGQFNRCQIVQCQIVHGLKLSGVKLSWCQIVLVSNCPRSQIVWC